MFIETLVKSDVQNCSPEHRIQCNRRFVMHTQTGTWTQALEDVFTEGYTYQLWDWRYIIT